MGNMMEKYIKYQNAFLNLEFVTETESLPAFKPALPIIVSIKRLALLFKVPLHTSNARIFKGKRSICWC